MEARLSKFLFSYRTTPQATTGVSPTELMFGCPLRTRLDLVLPDVAKRVCQRQLRMEDTRATSSIRSFDVGDPVLCNHPEEDWSPLLWSNTPRWSTLEKTMLISWSFGTKNPFLMFLTTTPRLQTLILDFQKIPQYVAGLHEYGGVQIGSTPVSRGEMLYPGP